MKPLLALVLLSLTCCRLAAAGPAARPNIILLMADDQGWGEAGYHGHPHLKTPALDEMAATGLRLDRFYAAAPVCSPTRTAVMTGRHPNRSGVFGPNYSTRPEEITIAQILKAAGYRTGHFGKWHIGAVKSDSPLNPARMGFDEFLSHDNFFEIDPPLSHNGAPPAILRGEGSEVIVDAATKFIRQVQSEAKPFFVVIWFGSPHAPYRGLPADVALYQNVAGDQLKHRFAEITAMDRAIGRLRRTLKQMDVATNTLVWFTSDNGISAEDIPNQERAGLYNGGWRGGKGGIYEGGLRVPAIIEWPAMIPTPRTSLTPCVSSDIFPTVLDLLQLRSPDPGRPIDGISLVGLIVSNALPSRPEPIGFWRYDARSEVTHERWTESAASRGTTPTTRNPAIQFVNYRHPIARTNHFGGSAAWTDNRFKLMVTGQEARQVELYDLIQDPTESKNIAGQNPAIVTRMTAQLHEWQRSVERSLTGMDYGTNVPPKSPR